MSYLNRIKKRIVRNYAKIRKTNPMGVDSHNKEFQDVQERFGSWEKEKIWAFTAGQFSQDFRGNPKYLFVYINNYRPDIKAYWLCDNPETIETVRSLGFDAYSLSSYEGQYLIPKTGVLVAEQVKESIPEGFSNFKYLNLWHGVGFKKVERSLFEGDIAFDIARKYVKRGAFYRDNQLVLCPCSITEEGLMRDLGVEEDKIIRAGYPRCSYQQNFKPVASFDHDLRKAKGLPESTMLIVYAPTYRAKLGGTFAKAIPDFERLYKFCEDRNILFVFKLHPNMEDEIGYLKAKEEYGDRPHFWFWDNKDDFYEIMHEMNLAIVDYSAIISDMISMGIQDYIRYTFDVDDYMATVDTHDRYSEMTTGKMCLTFDELLETLDAFAKGSRKGTYVPEEYNRLVEELWTYSKGKDDFDCIIEKTLEFKPVTREFPTLFSFDVFDTLISRKALDPRSIFYKVKEKMEKEGDFPKALVEKYPEIRHTAELNVREYYDKTRELRGSERVEITLHEIFIRLSDVYDLNDSQVSLLENWELEAEYEDSIPIPENIELLKSLIDEGKTVVLISDMYLPKEFIEKLLIKADPVLGEIPLFLSSDYGVKKVNQKLFFEVYKSFTPYYDFEKWIHFGDNENADESQPRKFNIFTRKIEKPEFNDIQESLVDYIGTYDSFLVSAMQARLIKDNYYENDDFVISYISLCFIPYISWVLKDAQKRGYKTLYFVSRDGYHLKRVADAFIETLGLDIKTKYIFGSRRLWRIPSYIDRIDEGFWGGYGNFVDLTSKKKLFKAMDINEEDFSRLFPYINVDTINFEDKLEVESLVEIFKNSKDYNDYLLNKAAEERKIVDEYFTQEINKDEKFAVVEYRGRGYNQDCMVSLWRNLTKDEKAEIPYYYSRSILPSFDGSPRHNFTTNDSKMYFVEAIFANMPYVSVEEYTHDDNGKVVPVLKPAHYERSLFDSMERILPEMARKYASLQFSDPDEIDRLLFEFVFKYYEEKRDDAQFAELIGTLYDSVTLYGKKREFAPPYNRENLKKFYEKELFRGDTTITTDVVMSVARMPADVRSEYDRLYQIFPGDTLSSGRVMDEEELATSDEFYNKFTVLSGNAEKFAEYYLEYSGYEEKRNIVLVSNGSVSNNKTLQYVLNAIKADDKLSKELSVKTLSLGKVKKDKDIKDAALEISKARFLIASEPIKLFAKTSFLEDTDLILLPNNPFNLYNQSLDVRYFVKWKEKYRKFAERNDVAVMQVPSEFAEERFKRNFSHSAETDCSLLGNCSTDIYFKNSGESCKEKVYEIFPEAQDKKIILYIPTIRKAEGFDGWANLLDMEQLQDLLGDEYALIFNYNKSQLSKPIGNKIEIPGFSKIVLGGIQLRELMIAADVIVGDYRDIFFESALLHKPVYSTAFDYEDVIKVRNITISDFREYIFGPIIRSSQDLADVLKRVDSYDYSKMEAFRNKFMSGCDGKSIDRVLEYIVNNR